ncbi:GlpM family protein [Ewingella americana]|uniref:GlpM family protein n=1 Tax=Ewingella americana TaxID=41202 RepID=UPI001883C2AC|nr:GlpM family protein [Ewingella americana]
MLKNGENRVTGLVIKALIGALMVIAIGILSKTRNYYLAGLLPLFPTFALIAHYVVGTERNIDALRNTIIFGLWGVIPYMVYLISLYFFIAWMKLPYALLSGVICWSLAAWLLISLWARFHA